jgi:hypothetical protein
MALSEFHRLNPTISLLDPEISIRFKNSSELHCPAPTPAIRGSVAANSLFLQFGALHRMSNPQELAPATF